MYHGAGSKRGRENEKKPELSSEKKSWLLTLLVNEFFV